MVKALFLFVLTVVGSFASLTAQEIRFTVPQYLPFTGSIDGKPGGIGVDAVTRIMNEAGLRMQVQVVPNYSRCILEVQNDECDGFFLGSQSEDRDAVAVLTDAVMINNWIWVIPSYSTITPSDKDFKATAHIGVMLNTNPHTWLKNNGYRIVGTPTSATALITMLDAGRFDAALVPEQVFLTALNSQQKTMENYRIVVQARQPFGIYLSKRYIASHPGILEKINKAIRKVALEQKNN